MPATSLSHSQLQHRKMLVFLPVVIVPFLTIFFYLMGGGKAVNATAMPGSQVFSKLNTDVPTAWKDNKIYHSKRIAYEKIGEDSMTIRRNTSRSLLDGGLEALTLDSGLLSGESSPEQISSASALNADLYQNRQQQANSPENKALKEATKVYQDALMASTGEKPAGNSMAFSSSSTHITHRAATLTGKSSLPASSFQSSPSTRKASVGNAGKGKTKEELLKDRLIDDYNATQVRSHKMLELLQKRLEAENAAMAAASRGESSPEEKKAASAQVASAKINIKPKGAQKPVVTHLEQRAKQSSYIYQAYSLLSDTIRKGGVPRANNGFYSADNEKKEAQTANVILAAIHDEQTLEAGSTVKIRLLHDIEVGGYRIPKGSFIFGIASIDNSRMAVNITSIYYKEMLFPVDLNLYDIDGIKGLSTPASVSRTMAKQGAAQAISGGNFIGTSPSPESQLTQKAIEVGEKVASRKLTAVRITLKAGHQVLLKPTAVENSK